MIKQLSAHGVLTQVKPRPSRAVCERVAREVAETNAMTFDAIVNSFTVKAKDARALAWARITEEVGCSTEGLADAWGCDRKTIVDGLARARRLDTRGIAA